ncbi:hypothetical protein B0E53_06834 [Micromonospora sp. MH33]|nr:hypothetical protein B0E53_06834 [Micromonospora sp. MH33]
MHPILRAGGVQGGHRIPAHPVHPDLQGAAGAGGAVVADVGERAAPGAHPLEGERGVAAAERLDDGLAVAGRRDVAAHPQATRVVPERQVAVQVDGHGPAVGGDRAGQHHRGLGQRGRGGRGDERVGGRPAGREPGHHHPAAGGQRRVGGAQGEPPAADRLHERPFRRRQRPGLAAHQGVPAAEGVQVLGDVDTQPGGPAADAEPGTAGRVGRLDGVQLAVVGTFQQQPRAGHHPGVVAVDLHHVGGGRIAGRERVVDVVPLAVGDAGRRRVVPGEQARHRRVPAEQVGPGGECVHLHALLGGQRRRAPPADPLGQQQPGPAGQAGRALLDGRDDAEVPPLVVTPAVGGAAAVRGGAPVAAAFGADHQHAVAGPHTERGAAQPDRVGGEVDLLRPGGGPRDRVPHRVRAQVGAGLEGLRQLALPGHRLHRGAGGHVHLRRCARRVLDVEGDVHGGGDAGARLVADHAGEVPDRGQLGGGAQVRLLRDPFGVEGDHVGHHRGGVEQRQHRVVAVLPGHRPHAGRQARVGERGPHPDQGVAVRGDPPGQDGLAGRVGHLGRGRTQRVAPASTAAAAAHAPPRRRKATRPYSGLLGSLSARSTSRAAASIRPRATSPAGGRPSRRNRRPVASSSATST